MMGKRIKFSSFSWSLSLYSVAHHSDGGGIGFSWSFHLYWLSSFHKAQCKYFKQRINTNSSKQKPILGNIREQQHVQDMKDADVEITKLHSYVDFFSCRRFSSLPGPGHSKLEVDRGVICNIWCEKYKQICVGDIRLLNTALSIFPSFSS